MAGGEVYDAGRGCERSSVVPTQPPGDESKVWLGWDWWLKIAKQRHCSGLDIIFEEHTERGLSGNISCMIRYLSGK